MKRRIPRITRLFMVLALMAGIVGSLVPVARVSAVTTGAVTVTPATAGSAAQYSIGITAVGAIAEDVGQFVVTFPAGTTVPATIAAASIVVTNTTAVTSAPANGNGTNATPPAPPTVSSRTVTITTPIAFAAAAVGTIIFSQSAGILNPTLAASVAAGTYTVSVAVAVAPIEAASVSGAYLITTSLTRSPTSGARSTSVAITGAGYTPSRSVDISFVDFAGTATVILSTTSDASGNISATVTVPSAAARGAGAFNALDGAGVGGLTTTGGTAAFTVLASAAFASATGLAGATVQITGSNWTTAGGPLELWFQFAGDADAPVTGTGSETVDGADADAVTNGALLGDGAPGAAIGGIRTLAAGDAANTTITIPAAATAGDKTIIIKSKAPSAGPAGVVVDTVTLTFTVTARTLTLTPSSGPVGTVVTVQGSSLIANGEIDPLGVGGATLSATNTVAGANGTLTIGALSWIPTGLGIPIDSAGNFNTSLTIGANNATPAATTSTAGAQTVTATDSAGRIATGTFTITARSITLSPTTGGPRSTVTVTGAGWPVSRTVTLLWGGTAWGSATADASGNFAFSAANLSGAAGASATVIVSADATTAAAVVLATVTANYTASGATMSAPISGSVGSSIAITGANFQPQTPLNAILLGGAQVHPGTTVVTDATGAWSVSVLVPGVAAGATQITTTVNVAGAPALAQVFTVTAAVATAATQLSALGSNLVRVWGYNSATGRFQLYDPNAAAASDLPVLVRGSGYWINVTAAQTVVIASNSYVLTAGWNLIGFLG